MNRTPDVELVLRDYFAEDGLTAPDHVLDVVEQRISRQPRRRTWRLPWRHHPMNRTLTYAAAIAAVLVIAVIGYSLLPKSVNGPGGVPTAAPSPSPTSVPAPSPTSVACEDLLPGCAGPLAAGTHQSGHFAPAFGYTTPDGWINTIDVDTLFALSTSYATPDPILAWSGIVPAEKGADCVLKAKAGAGTTVDDWVTYLTAHPGLNATNVHETALAGTRAVVLDLSSNLGWATPCADDATSKSVSIMKTVGDTPGDGYGTTSNGRLRLYLVAAGSQTVLVTIYSYSGGDAAFNAMLPTAEPIVQSFTFE